MYDCEQVLNGRQKAALMELLSAEIEAPVTTDLELARGEFRFLPDETEPNRIFGCAVPADHPFEAIVLVRTVVSVLESRWLRLLDWFGWVPGLGGLVFKTISRRHAERYWEWSEAHRWGEPECSSCSEDVAA